jgi:hypothetical protein
MTEVARGPHQSDQPEEGQFRSARQSLRRRVGRAAGESPSEVLLHQSELLGEVRGGGDGVQLDEGDKVRVERVDQAQRRSGTRREDEDVVEQNAEKVLRKFALSTTQAPSDVEGRGTGVWKT